METEGKRDGAVAAYRRSAALGAAPKAHYIRNWSAYRLGILEGPKRPPTSQPSSQRQAERYHVAEQRSIEATHEWNNGRTDGPTE
jgi:hypothetical protein